MKQKKVRITKDGITKLVEEKDVLDYTVNGWTVVTDEMVSPFATTFNKIK